MKKFIAGVLVGIFIFASTTVFADSIKSLVGSKVDGTFEVYYQGNKIGDAPVINDSTYLPVRKLTEATGMSANVEGKRINLEQTSASNIGSIDDNTILEEQKKQKAQIEVKISQLDGDIIRYKREIDLLNTSIQSHNKQVDEYKSDLAKANGKDPNLEIYIENINKMVQKELDDKKSFEAKVTAAQVEIDTLKNELSNI